MLISNEHATTTSCSGRVFNVDECECTWLCCEIHLRAMQVGRLASMLSSVEVTTFGLQHAQACDLPFVQTIEAYRQHKQQQQNQGIPQGFAARATARSLAELVRREAGRAPMHT